MVQFLHSLHSRKALNSIGTVLLLKIFFFAGALGVQAQNNALNLNGTNQYVAADGVSTALAGTATLSMEAWVFPKVLTGQRFILNFHDVSPTNNNLILFGTNGGNLQLSQAAAVASGSALPLNQWSHIALTIDASNNATVYLNGKVDFSATITNRPVTDGRFSIGQDWDGTNVTDVLDGYIDEVRVWSDVRTQADINANMFRELDGGETGLVAYYNMNAGNGTSLSDNSDNSSNSNTGTLVNSPIWKTSGALAGVGNALDFDGVDDYVEIEPDSMLQITGDLTVEAWAKYDDLGSDPKCQLLIYGGTGSESSAYNILYSLGIKSDKRLELFSERLSGSNVVVTSSEPAPIEAGAWHHYAIVRNASTQKVTFFVDGKQVGTIQSYDYNPEGGSLGPLFIGSETENDNLSAVYPFDGKIDEVRIWNIAKSATDIRETMMKTLTGLESGLAAYYRFDQTQGTALYDMTERGNNGVQKNMTGTEWAVSSAFNTWLGVESNDWTKAANWSTGVPAPMDNIGVYKSDLESQITISGLPTIDNLFISSNAAPTLSSGMTVNGNLILENDLSLNGQTITLGSSGFLVEEGGYLTGSSGEITTTRNVSNINEDVAGLGATISTTADLGSTTITRGLTAQAFGSHQGINRYFDITPSNNSNLNASLTLSYLASELNGNTESKLKLFKSTDSGSTWDYQDASLNTTDNIATITGVDAFSRWTLSSSPGISSFSPAIATVGENVVITGVNFTGTSQVLFGGTSAKSFTVDSDTQISAVVDVGSSGNLKVVTSNGSATEAGFEYRNHPPVLKGNDTSPTYNMESTQLVLFPDFTVSDPEVDAIDGMKIYFSSGYHSDQDNLSFSNTSEIAGSFDKGTGVLTLTGTTSAANYQAAVRSITYSNDALGTANEEQRVMGISLGNSAYFEETDHYYEYVSNPLVYADAKVAAESKSFYGLQGYLATVTSDKENSFIYEKIKADAWLGGSDEGSEGEWFWKSGPEEGTQFWTGGLGGSIYNANYASWNSGEPNNQDGSNPENYMKIYGSQNGSWNDVKADAQYGYVVEYGGMAGDPVVELSTSTTLNVDVTPPSGYSVLFDQNFINNSNEASASFTFAGAEVDATLNYTISSDGGATEVTGSGSIETATDQITGIDLSGLGDGTLTLTVKLTDEAGNVGSEVMDTKVKDTVVPTVTSVTVPANATYIAEQNLDFTINFSENVFVNTDGGTPQISITIGSTTRQAVYQSGSGTSALLFRYTVQAGESDADGITVGTLVANGSTLRDAASNNATLTLNSIGITTAVLVDALAPVADCKNNIIVQLDAIGNVSIVGADIDNGSSDAFGIASLSVSPNTFTCSEVGDNTVTMTVTDVNANSSTCSSTVTVADTIKPIALCKDITVYLDANGSATIEEDSIDNGSTDACGGLTFDTDVTTFSCSDISETNPVILTVTDANGNNSTCSSNVTVEDTISPTAVCKDITVQLDATGSATIAKDSIDDGSSDACGGLVFDTDVTTFSCSDISETNPVILTVTDANGNNSTCLSTVTVEDTISPVALCKDITVQLDETGAASIAEDSIDNGSTDACGLTFDTGITEFSGADIGDNILTLTVTDASGNTSQCTSTATVTDNTPPVIQCNPQNIILDVDGTYVLSTPEIRAFARGTTDNADVFDDLQIDVSVSRRGFNCTQVSEDLDAKVIATDQSGNQSSCWTEVTVNYPTNYEIIVSADDVIAEAEPGECSTTIPYPNFLNGKCTTFTQIEGFGPDSLFPIGTTTETWEMTDMNGNKDTVSFDVTVTPTNAIPTLDSIADVYVDTKEDATINVELTGISAGNDCEEQEATVTAESSNVALIESLNIEYVSGDTTAMLAIVLVPEASGTAEITVAVEDEMGATVLKTFSITVSAANDAPYVINPIPNQTVNASYISKVPVSSKLGDVFGDADNDSLTLEITEEGMNTLPDWATFANDTLVCQPMIADIGCVNIVIEASDGELTATDTFQVCVEGYPTAIDDLSAGQFEVNLYPNPTRGMVNVDVESAAPSDVELIVLDITGKQVLRKQYCAAQRITFDMSDRVSGMYFVKLDFEGQQVLKKLVVDRK